VIDVAFDAVIVGSGPAGISAAFPLAAAGWRLLILDGGAAAAVPVPKGEYLTLRQQDAIQWHWMVGRDFAVLRQPSAVSPKLHVPTLEHVFAGFAAANRIAVDGFTAVGSLAPGGLSNAWGAGVARFDESDLAEFPFTEADLLPSYASLARRIGISGRECDDLSGYFGVDDWAQPPMALDDKHNRLLARYRVKRDRFADFRMGRARVAVLSEPHAGRSACDESGLCLWGCHRGAVYSAIQDFSALKARGVRLQTGAIVESLEPRANGWLVCGRDRASRAPFRVSARRVLLAAGALASARLALRALGHVESVRLLSCPVAAFLLWVPACTGHAARRGVGLAQLSFVAERTTPAGPAFGNLFAAQAVPMAEFARHMPMARRYAIDALRALMTSLVVGNCFFPGALSDHCLRCRADGVLEIHGRSNNALSEALDQTHRRLRASFARLGAIMLPGSFTAGAPGADVHYAGTVPMRATPAPHEAQASGEIAGLPGVYVVDGAALSSLPAKAHTLTIMANADRVARELARCVAGVATVPD
jgi:choline dehydrogenase-like flavoprotein